MINTFDYEIMSPKDLKFFKEGTDWNIFVKVLFNLSEVDALTDADIVEAGIDKINYRHLAMSKECAIDLVKVVRKFDKAPKYQLMVLRETSYLLYP